MRHSILLPSLLIALLAAVVPPRASATDFHVNSTVDAVDAGLGDGVCATLEGDCTLRAAVQESNQDATEDRIILPLDTYTLALPGLVGETDASVGDLDLLQDVTVKEEGEPEGFPNPVIDADGIDRIFEVATGVAATIEGVDMTGGVADGGGAIVNRGMLTLRFCDVRNSESTVNGGGIDNTGSLNVSNCRIAFNVAAADGGGIANRTSGDGLDASVLLQEGSILRENTADYGGGLFNFTMHDALARAELRDGTALLNTGRVRGGGFFNRGDGLGRAELVLRRALLDTNGLEYPDADFGGGAFNQARSGGEAALYATNSTWSGNDAVMQGGALAQMEEAGSSADAVLANVTITKNTANQPGGGLWGFGGLRLRDSIVAGNENAVDGTDPDCASFELVSEGYNVIGELGSCTGEDATDATGVDPMLGALADNGGPTSTHLPAASSPAVDGGSPGGCTDAELGILLDEDQRGVPRPESAEGRCDVGAVELPEAEAGALALAALGALAALAGGRRSGPRRVDPPALLG